VAVRVLNQVPPASVAIAAVAGVECIDVTPDLAPDITADVLFGGYPDWARTLELLERGVRWVQLSGTGIDGAPPELFERAGVVTCARGASAVPISEYVLAVMLAFVKHLPEFWITEPPRSWNFQRMGTLAGRTVGIVGFGGIGRAVARRALAFDMDVVVLRRTDAPIDLPGVRRAESFSAMLPELDHLVLAAPATSETAHLVDEHALASVRPGLHLVNIARGALIDQDALRVALDDGRVARASLDVMTPEPLPEGHWLYSHPSVRLTPHSSWANPDLLDASIALFVANLERYRDGRPLEDVVDPTLGY
jgi:phosphoglycerate dehydrogenase-like enzyme